MGVGGEGLKEVGEGMEEGEGENWGKQGGSSVGTASD